MTMNTNQYPTIRSRLAIVLFVLAASFGAILSFILYINYSNELRDNLGHRLENITTVAGLQQNGDELANVHAQGDEYYYISLDRNAKIKRSDPDLRSVCSMREDAKRIYHVLDAR